MKQLRATAFLPPHLIKYFMPKLFEKLPQIADIGDRLNLRKFIKYVKKTWIYGRLRPYWSEWLNCGPYTTNKIKGYNNGLHSHFDNKQHPPLSALIEYFQTIQNNYCQIRFEAIENESVKMTNPKHMNNKYQQRNKRLMNEMQQFGVQCTILYNELSEYPTIDVCFEYINNIVNIFAETI
jgi:hypothetical protein